MSRSVRMPAAATRLHRHRLFRLAVLACVLAAVPGHAIVVPTGLSPGDKYYLAFVTKDETAATSTKIADYNDFVNAQAAQPSSVAAGVPWVAIASTAAVDAKDNVNFAGQSNTAPIYLLDGTTKVVAQASDLFAGGGLLNALAEDQFAAASASLNAWTGTDTNGVKLDPLGTTPARKGDPSQTSNSWISQGTNVNTATENVYAVSRLLTVPSPTPSPTGSPTPSPTETPFLDHFGCYEIHRSPLNRAGVSLVDQFGASTVTIEEAKRFCAPADKNDEDPGAVLRLAHMTSYKIKQTAPVFRRIANVPVTTQFGTQIFDLIRPERLLVPTAKSLTGTPSMLANPPDHFKCYKVKGPRFGLAGVKLATQFGEITVNIVRPLHFCTPVNKNNEDATAPRHETQLMCYRLKGPRPVVPDKVFTTNQFTDDEFPIFGPRELCVPAASPCASAGITLPTQLPDQTKCTSAAPPTDCNGWEVVGRVYSGPSEIGDKSTSGTDAMPWTMQLYRWDYGMTRCLYLLRADPGAAKTLNGVHCYNTDTCDVCAFDYPGEPPQGPSKIPPPITWNQLIPVGTGLTVDCAGCHGPGPVVPKYAFWSGVKSRTLGLNQTCTAASGPKWIAAPSTWVQRDNPLSNKVDVPDSCSGGSCHANFVKKAPAFCSEIVKPTFGPSGSMRGRFDDFDVCKKFTDSIGCTFESTPAKPTDDPFACKCLDKKTDGAETDVDCGGPVCFKCGDGKDCNVNSDCAGGDCTGGECQPTCTDGEENGNETDVDCGGGTCPKCDAGKVCAMNSDCVSNVCTGNVCQATCTDGQQNGAETDVDCGGGTCPACALGKACLVSTDCASNLCVGNVCS